MTRTEKRIEALKLLKLLRQDDERSGDTILRALRHLAGAAHENDGLRFELTAARNEIEIADGEIARLSALSSQERL